jgi:hypothetical protein
MEVQAMRRTLRSLLVALLVLSVGAGTVTATGRSGTDLNVCTNEAKDYYGGIKVYAKDEGKGADRVMCAPTEEQPSDIERDGEALDHRLNKRDERLPGLEDIWNGFSKNIESFELRAAAGCVTAVEVAVFRPIGRGEFVVTTLLVRSLDNIDGTEPETRLYEIPRTKDDEATALEITASCPLDLPSGPDPTFDAGDTVVAQSPPPSRTALDQRVEAPEAGIAVTFPDDWVVEVQPIMSDAVLSAEAPGGGSCAVMLPDHTRWSDLDDAGESFLSVMRDFGAATTSLALRLPVGDVIRIDTEVPEEGYFSSIYLLHDGTTFYGLMCDASDAPDDDWLSIAETFEFLPAEE